MRSQARLPHDKFMRCTSMLSDYLKRKKVTLRELQSLIFCLISVVLLGRAFPRRLIDLTIGMSWPQHLIKLTKSFKSGRRTWLAFLSNFNGSSLFLTPNWITSPSLKLYTDASGSCGYGAVFQDVLWTLVRVLEVFEYCCVRILPNCLECYHLGPFNA